MLGWEIAFDGHAASAASVFEKFLEIKKSSEILGFFKNKSNAVQQLRNLTEQTGERGETLTETSGW
jgi:hypothetical protein